MGKVYASCFGSNWFEPNDSTLDENGDRIMSDVPAAFPDMSSAKQREKFGPHSGVILVSA